MVTIRYGYWIRGARGGVRRVENELDRPWELIKRLGVQPVLVDQAHAEHCNDHGWVIPDYGQRHPEWIFENSLAHALTERSAEVVILRAVVRDMTRPQQPDLMVAPVEAVVR